MSLLSRLIHLELLMDSKARSEGTESCLAEVYKKLALNPLTMHAEAKTLGLSSPAEAVAAGLGMTVREFKAWLQAIAGKPRPEW